MSGPSLPELKRVKDVLKRMITHMRNLYLEKEYFKTLGVDPSSFAIKDARLRREVLSQLNEAARDKPLSTHFSGTLDKMQLSPDSRPAPIGPLSVTTSSESERRRAFGDAGLLRRSSNSQDSQDGSGDESEEHEIPLADDADSEGPSSGRPRSPSAV